MAPGLAVVLALVGYGLSLAEVRDTGHATAILLTVIGTVVSTTLVVLAQAGLNLYWEKARENILTDARIGVGEVVFVVLGILVWIITFIPTSYLE
jgi:hypothetical protein